MQCIALRRCARIGGITRIVKTTHVTYPDRVCIIAFGMGSRLAYTAATCNRAVKIYQKMITDAAESARFVPAVNIADRDMMPCLCCSAMNDYFIIAVRQNLVKP